MRKVRKPGKSSRRGATLVLVAVSSTVLVMFAGLGMDFGRMYTFVAQLKRLTDAASLAAAIELRNNGTEINAKLRALSLTTTNTVNGSAVAIMEDSNITPGSWNNATRVFTPGAWASATAVRARARYSANWTLARIFGVTSKVLTQESIASLGSINTSTCLKPWAVPYTNILKTLDIIDGGTRDTSYRLLPSDVTKLRDGAVPITFSITSKASGTVATVITPGNYYHVRYGPVEYADGSTPSAGSGPAPGASAYADAIANLNCTTRAASIGDWLEEQNGIAKGPTQKATADLCGVSNGKTFACSMSVVVPIWNRVRGSGLQNVQILYLGQFQLTGYDDGVVSGFLRTLNASGGTGFNPSPGPALGVGLVQ